MTHLHRLGAPTAALLVLALAACGGNSSSTESAASTSSKGASPKSKGASATSKGATSKSETASRIPSFGSEATGSEAVPAEAVVLGYLHASAAGEWSKACTRLSKSTRSFAERIAEQAKQTEGTGAEVTNCAGVVPEVTMALPAREREGLGKAWLRHPRRPAQAGAVRAAPPRAPRRLIALALFAALAALSSALASSLARAGESPTPGGSVPSTLSLSLSEPSPFTRAGPDLYTARIRAAVTATDTPARLSLADGDTGPGHRRGYLGRGASILPTPLEASAEGGPYRSLDTRVPSLLKLWSEPITRAPAKIRLRQEAPTARAVRKRSKLLLVTLTAGGALRAYPGRGGTSCTFSAIRPRTAVPAHRKS